MAKAAASCTCATCGKPFEIVRYEYNRKSANEFERWAEANCDECPECYRTRIRAEEAEKAAKIAAELGGVPEITGKSEKQIDFAISLRNQILSKSTAQEREFAKKLVDIKSNKPEQWREAVKKRTEKFHCREEAAEELLLGHYGKSVRRIAIAMLESNAGKLIDALKDW